VRPFWPFSERWYSWDIVFIVEPVLLILLLGGLILPSLFALINEEIGARRKGPRGRLAATLALIGVVAVWGLRDYEHRRAVSALESRLYENADPVRVSAYPYWWNPFRWYGIAETKSFFATMVVDSADSDVDPSGQMQIRYKPEETPAAAAARKSYLGQVFLDWARYPLIETEQTDAPEPGYIVRFQDLRFAYPGRTGRTPLSASVELDRNLKIVDVNFGIRRGRRGP
jgi:inner membrane protein